MKTYLTLLLLTTAFSQCADNYVPQILFTTYENNTTETCMAVLKNAVADPDAIAAVKAVQTNKEFIRISKIQDTSAQQAARQEVYKQINRYPESHYGKIAKEQLTTYFQQNRHKLTEEQQRIEQNNMQTQTEAPSCTVL